MDAPGNTVGDGAAGLRLSRAQVRAVDRLAIEELGIPGVVLMENAGRGAAEHVLAELRSRRGAARGARVVVLCGGGNNGGDGYVVARHLHGAGVAVELVATVPPGELRGDAATNARVALAMGLVPAVVGAAPDAGALADAWAGADLLVDGLLGTGFHGTVRPPLDAVIDAANRAGPPIVAVDVPSGLDADLGRAAGPAVRAASTVTFVARKLGFDAPGAAAWTGRVVVAGIGAPPELVARVAADPDGG